MEKAVLEGEHFWLGDVAVAEGAMAAGCRFFAGYPITPASEIAEHIAKRMPLIGGVAIQMEDEIASMAAILGASWAGKKSMTATSGPGISLMMENIGLGVMMEVPCVVVNVQRGGPSTGLPTLWAQADVMQARWGSHGDYEIIALSPASAQESFDFMIDAFNYSEEYRLPVIFLTDGIIGHITEKVVVPSEEEIESRIYPRRYTTKSPEEYLPFEVDGSFVPEMVKAGDGYRIHITGLTHEEHGYPSMTPEAQDRLVKRLVAKVHNNAKKIARYELRDVDGADIVVVTYGVAARLVSPAIERVKKRGVKVGVLRLITVWPFPEWEVRRLASEVAGFTVVEMNLGQIFYEVERCAQGKAKTILCGHAGGGLYEIDYLVETMLEAAK